MLCPFTLIIIFLNKLLINFLIAYFKFAAAFLMGRDARHDRGHRHRPLGKTHRLVLQRHGHKGTS